MDEPKKLMGRPTKFNEALIERIAALYESGLTDEQVADAVGVCRKTLHNWRGKFKTFKDAVKESKGVADDLVEASLFHRAIGYSHPEEKVFVDKGEIIVHQTTRHYPPDTVAAIFWLKNRRPDEWRDKQTLEHEGEIDHTVKVSRVDIDNRIQQLKGEAEESDGE